MKRFFPGILLIIASVSCMAQSPTRAEELFTANNYASAKTIYQQLVKKYPTNTLYLYRYARCAQETGDYTTAIKYFQLSGDKYTLKHFYLGESYMALWRHPEALESYQTYLSLTSNEEKKQHINEQIALAEKRARYLKRVENLSILGYTETSKHDFLSAYPLSENAGKISQDTAGSITFYTQRGDRCIFASKSDSTTLLCSRFRLLDNWEKPDTLPQSINISSIQNYPYCLNDGVTIYFASNHEDGMGGLDIYITRYNTATETFTTPENLGFPFNSTGNDYMFAVDEEKGTGYFATDRFSAKDSVRIYSFVMNDQKSYLRGMSADTLAMYARLELYNKADSTDIKKEKTADAVKDHTIIRFILNDSTVYTSMDEFKNEEAKQMYEEYIRQNARLEAISYQLENLRTQWTEANEEERKNISSNILTLEKGKGILTKSVQQTLLQVRQKEME